MQSNKKLDNFIVSFSRKMSEFVETKSNILLKNMIEMLMKRKKFALDQDLWRELYLQSIYFYKNNHIASIPSVFVTKHNEILPFYMKQKISETDCTILRFDTHSDLNFIKGSARLPLLYKKYSSTNNQKYIDEAQEIVWDIGASKSGVLMTTGIKDVIWGMPSWVPDRQIDIEFFIKNNKKNLSLRTTCSEDYNDIDFDYSIRVPPQTISKKYRKIQTGRLTLRSFEKIIEMISKNGKKYILDVDLDYFVCNGQKFDKSYCDTPFDLQSYDRTKEISFNQNVPRNHGQQTQELLRYEKSLLTEIEKINKRIKLFLRLINNIKKRGLIPCCISICDSSNVLFQNCKNCNSISNGYVPMNLALYVHTKVVNGLTKIF